MVLIRVRGFVAEVQVEFFCVNDLASDGVEAGVLEVSGALHEPEVFGGFVDELEFGFGSRFIVGGQGLF